MTEAAHDLSLLLSPEERARRAELEEVVQNGLAAFIEVGEALSEIRDQRLYRDTHETFEAYCQDVWKFSRQRAHQLIDAAGVAQEAVNQGLTLPTERHARAMLHVPAQDIGVVAEVTRALTGREQPTSAQYQAVADTVRDMAEGSMVEHPQTGESVSWDSLPPEQRAPALGRAVQRGAKDRSDFQGTDDVKPWEWIDGLRPTAFGAIHFGKDGYRFEITDTVTNFYWIAKTPAKTMFDAIRAARAVLEAETRQEETP